MISYREALDLILAQAQRSRTTAAELFSRHLGATEVVGLKDSVGRVTAQDILSLEALPAFDTAAMDGFAVRSLDCLKASPETPTEFDILGLLAAGDPPPRSNSARPIEHPLVRGAWEVMTGAVFPAGFDACVRQEEVELLAGGKRVALRHPALVDQNRRVTGEDFLPGSLVLKKGHRIRHEDWLCLAAVGISAIEVQRRIRIALIATGPELVEYDQKPNGTQIRNSTTPYLVASLRARNAHVSYFGIVGDEPARFLSLVEKIQEECFDLILTTGAISVGKHDYVAKSLKQIGMEIFFQKVAIRPGKPILFGQLPQGSFVLGLPGNPLATATGLRFFLDPLLTALAGQSPERPIRARLQNSVRKPKGPTCFLKARATNGTDGFDVFAHENQKASITSPLVNSNGWMRLDDGLPETVATGTRVDFYPFSPLF